MQEKQPTKIARQILYNGFLQQTPHHLYILVAPTLVQQQALYQWYIQLHVCENRQEDQVCNACHGCQQVMSGNYINSIIVAHPEDKKSIGVGEIAQLQDAFVTTASLDATRFFCVEHADILTVQAANSMLKFLEEPTGSVVGFLFVTNENKLLTTIASRGQLLRLADAPLEAKMAKKVEDAFSSPELAKAATYLLLNNYDEKLVFKHVESMYATIESYLTKLAVGSPPIVAQTELEDVAVKTKTGTLILDLYAYMMQDYLQHKTEFAGGHPELQKYVDKNAVALFISLYEALLLTSLHTSIGMIMTKYTLEMKKRIY